MDPLGSAIDAVSERVVEIASRLVAIPSDGPAHDERLVVAALADEATSLGLPRGVVVAGDPAHPNLVIRIVAARPGRVLILTAHTDTKPPGPEPDPWSGAVRDGRLHGLGSADAKGSVAAMLVAAAALAGAGLPSRGELRLVFSADEESEGTRGLAHLASDGLLAADAAIVGEPSGVERSFDGLPVTARGFVGLTVRARGRRRHSALASRDDSGDDPLAAIGRAILGLPEAFRSAAAAVWPGPDGLGGPPRLTFTSMAGGGADGILADAAWARGEVRIAAGQSVAEVEAALRTAMATLPSPGSRVMDLDLEIDPDEWPASAVDPSATIVTALADATERVTGRRPSLT
ncbi:MAG TPA: M20/M25/M40 family metallo-hydrolase, partial [Candidatus Deferrimicrobium sp.]|nr:M20/M25/M40 family metallo-hydrolase [Candidatus Deferrimicrobium sp.]